MIIEELDQILEENEYIGFVEKWGALFEKRFKGSDLNLKDRVMNHWKVEGILPNPKGKRLKLNFFELIWVEMVKDMRKFGLSIDVIRIIKENLLTPIELVDFKATIPLLSEYWNKTKFDQSEVEIANEVIRKGIKEEDFEERFKEYQDHITLLMSLIAGTLTTDLDYSILADHDGNSFIAETDPKDEDNCTPDSLYNYNPYMLFPIKGYIRKFMLDPLKLDYSKELKLLKTEEAEVIRLMNDGELKELKIIFNRTTKTKDIVTTYSGTMDISKLTELLDTFKNKKHSALEVKIADGTVFHYNYENRKRY